MRTRMRWVICLLLFVATTIIYIDRAVLGLAKPLVLDKEMGWNYNQYSDIVAYFQAAYAIGFLGYGWFIDRFGVRMGYLLTVGLWSLAVMSHSLAGNIAQFRLVRIFVGGAEAGNFPSAIKAVAQWFPQRERAYASALFNSGANVSQVIAPLIFAGSGGLLVVYGWKTSFVVVGVCGFVWMALWLLLYSLPEKSRWTNAEELAFINSDKESSPGPEKKVSWLRLLAYRQTWSFVVGKFMTDGVWWFLLYFLGDYFSKSQHVDIQKPLTIIYIVVTVLSILGGWLSNYLIKRGWTANRARKGSMLLFALMVAPIVGIHYCGLWGSVALIALAGSAHQAWSANLFTTVSDMFPKRAVASVVGIGGMAGSLGGILFQKLIAGKILTWFNAKGELETGYWIIFMICAIAYPTAFAISHLLAPKFEQVNLDDDPAQPAAP